MYRSECENCNVVKKAYFLSDIHLGAHYRMDSKVAECRIVGFHDTIKEDADEIYLLGDVLDYWYEYRYVVPKGYVRFFGKLAELSDIGVKITWLIGNHDIWIFDYLPSEIGLEVVDGVLDREVLGVRMVMAHGDGIWNNSRRFRLLRSLFRNRFCQWLYSGIHPRWTVPFAYAWSRHSRRSGEMSSCASDSASPDDRRRASCRLQANIEGLKRFSREYLREHPDCRYFLYGHLHTLLDMPLKDSGGARILIVGDWLTRFSYAVFDGREMKLVEQWDGAEDY